jgi:hypothetical protein
MAPFIQPIQALLSISLARASKANEIYFERLYPVHGILVGDLFQNIYREIMSDNINWLIGC